MAEIVNLRLARKAKARAGEQAAAAANRAKHGRSKGEKQQQLADAERQARQIDGAHRERD